MKMKEIRNKIKPVLELIKPLNLFFLGTRVSSLSSCMNSRWCFMNSC